MNKRNQRQNFDHKKQNCDVPRITRMESRSRGIKPLYQPEGAGGGFSGRRAASQMPKGGGKGASEPMHAGSGLTPRSPQGKAQALFKLEIFAPQAYIEPIIEAATELGACHVGNYDYVASYYPVEGCWRPLEGASPYDGEVGKISRASEYKLEIRCLGKYVRRVMRRVREIHPYEEPLINVVRLDNSLFED